MNFQGLERNVQCHMNKKYALAIWEEIYLTLQYQEIAIARGMAPD